MSIADSAAQPPPQRTPTVIAAGGVVLDGDGPSARVLVVHRPAHADWSLPKGHVDAGEAHVDAALREVSEETGVRAHVIGELGTTQYPVMVVRDGGTHELLKRVHWFTMRPVADADDPATRAADTEVDVAAWWTVQRALAELTHADDRALLARALEADD